MLRQLLGALKFDSQAATTELASLDSTGETLVEFRGTLPDVLALHLPDGRPERIKIDFRFADGTKQKQSLIRKKHVPVNLQSDWWAISLMNFEADDLLSATLRYDAGSIGDSAKAHAF